MHGLPVHLSVNNLERRDRDVDGERIGIRERRLNERGLKAPGCTKITFGAKTVGLDLTEP